MNLDELLADAAPAVTPRTTDLTRELDALAAACEAERPARRRLRLGLATAATAGVLAVGTATAATGLVPMPGWLSWSTSEGESCEMGFDVQPGGNGNGEPVTEPYTQADVDETVAAARAFLASYDYASIDSDRAIAQWQAEESEARATQPPDERQPKLTGADLEITAVGRMVARDLVTHLERQGLNDHLVVFTQGWRCDG